MQNSAQEYTLFISFQVIAMDFVVFYLMSYCHVTCFVIGVFMLYSPLCTHPIVSHFPPFTALYLRPVNIVYVTHVPCTLGPGETFFSSHCVLHIVPVCHPDLFLTLIILAQI